ncbi:MAG TPA: PAS domain-containing protein, partial [Pyrinomonadaceae bacterium]|nr:PAS domain-containing protein [Pyrinomonadaceae bacterium]
MEHTDFFQTDLTAQSVPSIKEDSVEILTAAFDALPDAFYLFDTSARLSRINPAGARLENSAVEALLGSRCCEMFWRVEGASECVVERACASGEKVEVEILAGEKSDRPTLVIVVPVRASDGTLTGSTLAVARD